MLWVFNRSEVANCKCLGRLKASFYNYNTDYDDRDTYSQSIFQEILTTLQEEIEGGEDDSDDFGIKTLLKTMKQKYSIGKSLNKLSQTALIHLLCREILSTALDYRTYFSHFCFTVRETDYSGTKQGIVKTFLSHTRNYGEEDKLIRFIRVALICGNMDDIEELVNTSAFYIPGMKEPSYYDDEEGNEEGDEE
jgi:hypothetical protein